VAEQTLKAAGVELPLADTPAGPLIAPRAAGELEPLAWVINGAFGGTWDDLAELLRMGEDARSGGPYAYRPTELDDDVDAAAARWRELSGSDPGDDVLIVGPGWATGRLLVPRAALIELIERLAELRRGVGDA
jgi:hypothetical protein